MTLSKKLLRRKILLYRGTHSATHKAMQIVSTGARAVGVPLSAADVERGQATRQRTARMPIRPRSGC